MQFFVQLETESSDAAGVTCLVNPAVSAYGGRGIRCSRSDLFFMQLEESDALHGMIRP
jgi:hypothetical protein